MKITATKIKRELVKNYGWSNCGTLSNNEWFVDELLKDTLKIVDKILREQKNISIK